MAEGLVGTSLGYSLRFVVQIKAKGRISRPTALLVDKSSSMHEAIELGKRIGAMVSAICESKLVTYAFDTMAHEIVATGESLADWERAFAGITAGGATSCGVALKNLQRKKQYVEQITMVTDEQQNTLPAFVPALREYCEAMQANPTLVIVRTPGGSDFVEKQCRRENVPVDVFNFEGDYYSLPRRTCFSIASFSHRRCVVVWFGSAANFGDARIRIEGMAPLQLTQEVQLFDCVRTRFDGSQFWFDEIDMRHDLGAAAFLRSALNDTMPPDDLKRRGLTAEERAAYELNYWQLLKLADARKEDHGSPANALHRRRNDNPRIREEPNERGRVLANAPTYNLIVER